MICELLISVIQVQRVVFVWQRLLCTSNSQPLSHLPTPPLLLASQLLTFYVQLFGFAHATRSPGDNPVSVATAATAVNFAPADVLHPGWSPGDMQCWVAVGANSWHADSVLLPGPMGPFVRTLWPLSAYLAISFLHFYYSIPYSAVCCVKRAPAELWV